jgi:hypothetical protein
MHHAMGVAVTVFGPDHEVMDTIVALAPEERPSVVFERVDRVVKDVSVQWCWNVTHVIDLALLATWRYRNIVTEAQQIAK